MINDNFKKLITFNYRKKDLDNVQEHINKGWAVTGIVKNAENQYACIMEKLLDEKFFNISIRKTRKL